MIVLYLGLLGLLVFVAGSLTLGDLLRRYPSPENAETSSRIMHALFFIGLGVPFVIAVFYPGLNRLDALAGLKPLPLRPVLLAAGFLLAPLGLYLQSLALRSLRNHGRGANAFRLTKRIVDLNIYKYSRNPMSLGYYLIALSITLFSGSTLMMLFVLLGLIPAHLFFLKFFEETELEQRFGDSYRQYKQNVPFLIPRRPAKRPFPSTTIT